jgi:hypothetical protein
MAMVLLSEEAKWAKFTDLTTDQANDPQIQRSHNILIVPFKFERASEV